MHAHSPQIRSKDVRLHIDNTHTYALRKVNTAAPGHDKDYTSVSGELTKRLENANHYPHENTRRDLKFRSVGEPVVTGPGLKELHMEFSGSVKYSQTNEFQDIIGGPFSSWSKKPATMDDATWTKIRRHATPLIQLDVELWLQNEGRPAPLRLPTRGELDTDWSPNAPYSRTDVVMAAQEFSTAPFDGDTDSGDSSFLEAFGFLLGKRKFTITNRLPMPVVQLHSLSGIVVPVVTLHIGGRSLGADEIEVDFQLEGKAYYLA